MCVCLAVLRQEIRELMHKLKQSQDKKETQMSTQNKGLEFKRLKAVHLCICNSVCIC